VSRELNVVATSPKWLREAQKYLEAQGLSIDHTTGSAVHDAVLKVAPKREIDELMAALEAVAADAGITRSELRLRLIQGDVGLWDKRKGPPLPRRGTSFRPHRGRALVHRHHHNHTGLARQICSRPPELFQQLGLEVLPALPPANVRELRQAVWPIPQRSPDQARHLVAKPLLNRARATRSRWRKQRTGSGKT
jgi:hypothetical protein